MPNSLRDVPMSGDIFPSLEVKFLDKALFLAKEKNINKFEDISCRIIKYVHMCVLKCMCIHVSIGVCECVYIYIHTYILIYIHT